MHARPSPFRLHPFALPACSLAFALLLAACSEPARKSTIDTLLPPPSLLSGASIESPPATASPVDRPTAPMPAGRWSPTPPHVGAALTLAAGDDVTLDFIDADIPNVARAVLVDILHLTLTIDPRVTGKVTLQTSAPIKRDAVLPLLEDAFRMNGAAILATGDRVEVVPADAAKFSLGTARFGTARGPGWRTQIVPLRFANATDLQKTLESMLPIGAAIHAVPSSNALVLTGSGTEINNLLEAINAFDNDALNGKSFVLWPLQVADSRAIVADLNGIFVPGGANEAGANIRFLPIVRLNAVLGIASDSESLRRAGEWVEKLDQADHGNETQLFVYRVNSGRASHFADLLAKLYPDDFVDTVGSEHNNQGAASRQKPAAAAGQGGEDMAARSVAGVLPGGAGTAAPAAPAGATVPAGITLSPLPQEASAPRGNAARIIADTVGNRLLIEARPVLFRRIEADLRKLDVMPAQVTIEATILEVTLTDQLSLGTQFYLNSGKSGFKLAPDSTGAIGPIAPGFSYVWPVNGPKLVLDALKDVTDVNVVSAPTMMVLDNETAKLQVGDQVPVITSTQQSTLTSGAPLLTQVEYHDTGIILAVTPRIAGQTVMLELQQEVSQVTTTTTSDIDSPTFQQRRFYSSVAVGDGETLLMGGLISTQRTRSNQGIPGLSEIPWLGALFDDRSDTTSRTELLVMITPHIVRNQAEAAAAADEIRRRIRETPTPSTRVLP